MYQTTFVADSQQETLSSPIIPSPVGPKSFILKHHVLIILYKSSFKYSGAKLYTPVNLRSQRKEYLEAENVEIICLELHLWKKTILLGTIYRPLGADYRVLDSIAGMLDRVAQEQKEVVLMGDFNCDMLKPQPSVATREFFTSTEELNLSQLITNPTRVTNHSASLIDLLFTTNPNIFLPLGPSSVTGSDHQIIYYGLCHEKLLLIPTSLVPRPFHLRR